MLIDEPLMAMSDLLWLMGPVVPCPEGFDHATNIVTSLAYVLADSVEGVHRARQL